MFTSRSVGRTVAAVAVAGLALSACTSSKHGAAGGSPSQPAPSSAASSATQQPVGAGSTTPSGSASGSKSPAHGRSTPPAKVPTKVPTKAPYPTPGRDPATPVNQAAVLTSLPGSAKVTCAQVGSNRDLRSGSIGMGNFQNARHDFSSQLGHTEVPQLNMYIIPEHTKHLTSATVRVAPTGSGKPSIVRTNQVEDAEPYQYFALVLPIAHAGTYRLTVTSGTDTGCFIVSFTK